MKLLVVVLAAVAAVCLAEDAFGFGAVKAAKAGYASIDQTRKQGQFMSKKSVTVNKVKFQNPTYTMMSVGGTPTPAFRTQIGKKVFFYPLSGTHSGMWLIYKANKSGGKKLVVEAQKFRVWYRRTCSIDSFTSVVKCGYCFKIFSLSGVLDYGTTASVTISSIKYDMKGYYKKYDVHSRRSMEGGAKGGRGGGASAVMEGVVTKVTTGGESYPLFLALKGKYNDKIIVAARGKIRTIPAIKLDIYRRKYCSRGLYGAYRCRYCFILKSQSKTTFLPGPNILIGSEDGKKIYLNSPQYMPTDIKVENKVKKREAVRLIFSQGKNIAFCFYVLDGEEAGSVYMNVARRGWVKTQLGKTLVIYTRKVCDRKGDKKSCYVKLKTYKKAKAPGKTTSVTVGKAKLGKPVVALVKTPGWKESKVRSAVFTGSTYSGDQFNLMYAMDGGYAGTWYYVITRLQKTKEFTPAASKALYNYKYCKASWDGNVKCYWCFLVVNKNEKASSLPKGKTVTINGGSFMLPKNVKRQGGSYVRMLYSKGKVNKTLFVKLDGDTAAAGSWFVSNKQGRLAPFMVNYDAYYQKSCLTVNKKTECRRCFIIQQKPSLAFKPLLPAVSVTKNKIALSISDTKLHAVLSGSKTGGKAHKFKGCKSGKCAEFYYMATGPMSGKWFAGSSKTGIYMSSSLFSTTLWKHYECADGLAGVSCRYCFQF